MYRKHNIIEKSRCFLFLNIKKIDIFERKKYTVKQNLNKRENYEKYDGGVALKTHFIVYDADFAGEYFSAVLYLI